MVKKLNENYEIYLLQKNPDKKRIIQKPSEALKQKQKTLIKLYEEFPLHEACSCKKGSGALEAAQPHLGARYLLKVDISNCFQRVELSKVQKIILDSNISDFLKTQMIDNLGLCFIHWEGKRILPTGSPTSPILCNIALSQIDSDVNQLAIESGYKYTRYMDDLNLSTTNEERKWELIHIVSNILCFSGYPTNIQKTKWFGKGDNDAKIVAGVNLETISRRQIKRRVRARLNNIARSHQKIDPVTRGYLSYIKSIDLMTYNKFIEYFNKRKNLFYKEDT